MSTTLFARQWTLQKSGLRLPLIGWSANFANSSLLFNTAQGAIKQPFWALFIVVYNCFKIWANICHCPKTLKENLLWFWYPPNYPWLPKHWANKGPTWSLHSFNCNESLSEWKAHFIGGPKLKRLECKAEKQNAFPQFQVGFEWVRGQWIHESFEVMRVRKCLLHYTALA